MSIDTIFQFLRTLLGGLIDKFKLANPALYTSIVTILLTAEGFLLVLLDRDIFKPAIEATLEVVILIVGGILTVIGANEVARRSERFKNISAKGSTRTWVLTFAVLAAFVASVWLFSKKSPNAPAEETIYLSAAPDAPVEAFSAPAEISNPETGPQPIRPYFVQVLYYRLDTLSSVPTGGLPSFKVVVRRDVTVDFPRVLSSGIPPLSLFQNVRVPGYPNQDRVFNAIILNQ